MSIEVASLPESVGTWGTDEEVGRARTRLNRRAEIWNQRPLVRDIYRGYHQAIRESRSAVPGVAVELGAGHGSMADSWPDLITSDVIPCPWLHCAADACHLPFRNGALSNLILLDVLHHLEDPLRFFTEAARTLAPGGRILMLEPYTSPISWIAWRYVHEEDVDLSADLLTEGSARGRNPAKQPWDANLAIPTLLFWRRLDAFRARFPSLTVVRRERFDFLLYPLSGGFEQRPLIPRRLASAVRVCERLLTPLAWLLAFRCLVVLEKLPADAPNRKFL